MTERPLFARVLWFAARRAEAGVTRNADRPRRASPRVILRRALLAVALLHCAAQDGLGVWSVRAGRRPGPGRAAAPGAPGARGEDRPSILPAFLDKVDHLNGL